MGAVVGRGGIESVLAWTDKEDKEKGGADTELDLVWIALEDLRANSTMACFCIFRPTDTKTDNENTNSGGTFFPNVHMSFAIFLLSGLRSLFLYFVPSHSDTNSELLNEQKVGESRYRGLRGVDDMGIVGVVGMFRICREWN